MIQDRGVCIYFSDKPSCTRTHRRECIQVDSRYSRDLLCHTLDYRYKYIRCYYWPLGTWHWPRRVSCYMVELRLAPHLRMNEWNIRHTT